MKQFFKKHPRVKFIAIELLLFTGIVGGFFLVLNNIQDTTWKGFLFNNADMLTLSLVADTIKLNEPFHWIFSSQVFLFPEALLYAISSLFSDNFKVVLLINAFLNITLLYALLRFMLATLTKDRSRTRVFGFLFTLFILLILAFLETRGYGIAFYFLVTTAYYGVILSALFVLACSILIYKYADTKEKHTQLRWLLGILFGVILLTGTSNPLFFLQVSAPLVAVVVGMTIFKLINKRTALLLTLPHIIGVIAGFAIRKTAMQPYLSPLGEISNYFHFKGIFAAIEHYGDFVARMFNASLATRIELFLIIFLLLSGIVVLTLLLWSILRKKKNFFTSLSTPSILVIAFAVVAGITTFCGTIITGNPILRYLLPLIFLVPLFLLPLLLRIPKKAFTYISIGTPITIVAVILIVALRQPIQTVRELASYYPEDTACLDQSLAGTPYKNGIAQYWRARPLQLNSQDRHIVLQVTGKALDQFPWLYNTYSYNLYDLSFVVVDKPEATKNPEISTSDSFIIPARSPLGKLGQPNQIYQCNSFDIYAYDEGTPGYKKLNTKVRGIQ